MCKGPIALSHIVASDGIVSMSEKALSLGHTIGSFKR